MLRKTIFIKKISPCLGDNDADSGVDVDVASSTVIIQDFIELVIISKAPNNCVEKNKRLSREANVLDQENDATMILIQANTVKHISEK